MRPIERSHSSKQPAGLQSHAFGHQSIGFGFAIAVKHLYDVPFVIEMILGINRGHPDPIRLIFRRLRWMTVIPFMTRVIIFVHGLLLKIVVERVQATLTT